MSSRPQLLNDLRARVAHLKREFPEADDDAIESFVCDAINFEQAVEESQTPRKTAGEGGLWAAIRKWWRSQFAK